MNETDSDSPAISLFEADGGTVTGIPAYTVDVARVHDLDQLVPLVLELARESEGKELCLNVVAAGVATMLRDPRHGPIFVARARGTVVGYLAVCGREWSDWRNG